MIVRLHDSLAILNHHLLKAGRGIGAFAIAVMVSVILVQVFFRYVLGNALPWPDEAARFCMLWMTGLMAPSALRTGGFVAIDSLLNLLPSILARALMLMLLLISLAVIVTGVEIGWKEVTGFGGLFKTASLYLPLSFSFDEWWRIPRSWMMASLVVGLVLMLLVNVELLLRTLLGKPTHLPVDEVEGTAC